MYQNERPAQSENELFPIIAITEQNGNQVVNARDLHRFLEVKSDFKNWINNRIKDYGFIENQDFEVLVNFYRNPKTAEISVLDFVKNAGGRPSKEYAITLDMAKELAMVERNEKGRIARRYFIEIDKKYRVVAKKTISTDFIDARDLVFGFLELKGKKVRHIIIDEKDFYSINDIHDAIGAKTNGNQVAKKLNAKKQLAQKIYIFGSTNPSWFTTGLGMQLILQGSRVLKSNALIS